MSDHILLIIVIAVLILGAVKGYRKGFLRLAVWFAALVAALFVVTRIAPHVSSFLIENTTLKEKIEEKIVEAYENKNASRLPDSTLPGDEGQKLFFPDDAGYIPFRCLVTKDFPNLLVAGRAISADEEAFAAIRVQVPCMETGQAAGAAAAMCLQAGGISVTDLDGTKVAAEVRAAGSNV